MLVVRLNHKLSMARSRFVINLLFPLMRMEHCAQLTFNFYGFNGKVWIEATQLLQWVGYYYLISFIVQILDILHRKKQFF